MEIDLLNVTKEFEAAHIRRYSRHAILDRIKPGIFQYDYLSLRALTVDVERLIMSVPYPQSNALPLALDVGCGKSPYREIIEARGFGLKTLDIDDSDCPDYIGDVENTGLPSGSFFIVICTQVLEHLTDPLSGLREIFRILKPGGHLILSAPHVWFYHPHPSDNWRFTQEGLPRIVQKIGFKPKKLLSQGGSILCYFQIINFLLFGILGQAGGPIYAANNTLAKLGERFIRNSLFCLNFALLAQKPSDQNMESY
jgi:SAM-dependent methyltransferase